MNYRELMARNDENLGWCKPLCITSHGKQIVICVNEGEIVGCEIDGVKRTMDWGQIARLVDADYGEYVGCSDSEIAMDADWDELPCSSCPFFGICDAMDEEIV